MAKSNLLVFTLFTSIVLCSGIAARLGRSGLSFWPWSHQWFMFSYSSDYHYKMRVIGYDESNNSTIIPLDDYFAFPASPMTNRADEMRRTKNDLRRLADFLRERNPGLTNIKIYHALYAKQPGKRPDWSKPPDYVNILLQQDTHRD